jgi:hypothetical protein
VRGGGWVRQRVVDPSISAVVIRVHGALWLGVMPPSTAALHKQMRRFAPPPPASFRNGIAAIVHHEKPETGKQELLSRCPLSSSRGVTLVVPRSHLRVVRFFVAGCAEQCSTHGYECTMTRHSKDTAEKDVGISRERLRSPSGC